jgi:hypothetical protein
MISWIAKVVNPSAATANRAAASAVTPVTRVRTAEAILRAKVLSETIGLVAYVRAIDIVSRYSKNPSPPEITAPVRQRSGVVVA